MTFKELKNKIKEEQKTLAQEIKEYKGFRKECQDGYVEGLWHRQNDYRHTHIAYCEFFNRTPYERIEQPSDWNKPNSDRLKFQQMEWTTKLDEALRDCA